MEWGEGEWRSEKRRTDCVDRRLVFSTGVEESPFAAMFIKEC